MPAWAAPLVLGLGALGLLFITVDLLIRPLFLGDDSVNNYAHVWYISQQLFHHARLPLRISMLDGGKAPTFPYGFVPFTASAFLAWPLGDWAVTFMMMVAVLGTVWAAALVRPVMRDPWLMLLFLLNPFFIDAIFAFQFLTLWLTLFFFLFVWAFEARRYVLAAVLLWLAVSTHPLVGGLAACAYGACLLAVDREKLRAFLLVAVPVAVAAVPFYWMMLLTPSVRENSTLLMLKAVIEVIPRRGSILLLPFALPLFAPWLRRHYLPSLAAISLAAGFWIIFSCGILGFHHGSYYGAVHGSTDNYADFFKSSAFEPGATYRVMEPNEREDGMYYFMRQGAIFPNDFFSESTFRRNWTEAQYRCYVTFKDIDYVVIERAYLQQYHRNEQSLLESLVAASAVRTAYTDPQGRFTVYDIRRFAHQQARSASLSECGLY